jgi:antitoxin component YwqK of YwqJK toxin-antitoxin module
MAGNAADKAPVDMFQQDYDPDKDVFYVVGTKEPYNGPVFSVYDNGGKEAEGTLSEGKEDGHWIEYHENGIKSAEGIYRGGLEVGVWKYWHESGKEQSEGAYSAGLPIGRWKTFYEDGKPESEGVFVSGLAEGDWMIYDEVTGKGTIVKYKNGEEVTP